MKSESAEVLTPTWFWESFQTELTKECTHQALSSARKWTQVVTHAAMRVCGQLGPSYRVDCERVNRLDVYAQCIDDNSLAIAFESELAPVGYKGRTHEKTWREEFVKLCKIPAQLRVLSAYFNPGEGPKFNQILRAQLDDLKDCFLTSQPSRWLLVFGSEDSTIDPEQPWLPYSLEPDFSLRKIEAPLFYPRQIANRIS